MRTVVIHETGREGAYYLTLDALLAELSSADGPLDIIVRQDAIPKAVYGGKDPDDLKHGDYVSAIRELLEETGSKIRLGLA